MSKDFMSKDKHHARKMYDHYSKSLRSRKISPEFQEMLELSDDDRCFRLKIVGSTTIEDLLAVIENAGVKPIPGGWNKILISVIVYANKKQIIKLLEKDQVKYIRYFESESCEL
jgi:hypothetical protein